MTGDNHSDSMQQEQAMVRSFVGPCQPRSSMAMKRAVLLQDGDLSSIKTYPPLPESAARAIRRHMAEEARALQDGADFAKTCPFKIGSEPLFRTT